MKKEYIYNKKWVRNEYLTHRVTAAVTPLFPVPIKNATVHGRQLYIQDYVDEIHGLNIYLACATYLNGCPCILRDSIYADAPEDVQMFLTEHELSHLILEHVKPDMPPATFLGRFKRLLPWSVERQNEYAADKRAAEMVGSDKGIEALTWILDNIQVELPSKLELKDRIRRLKGGR